jgi:hypothetical protein
VTPAPLLAAPTRHLRRSLPELRDKRIHLLPPAREHFRFALHMRGQDGHGVSVAAGQAVPARIYRKVEKTAEIPQSEDGGSMSTTGFSCGR